MDQYHEELFTDDDSDGDFNLTIVNGSDVVRVDVGVGGVATGIALYVLSFLTFVGNAMVLHAIRTEKRLQTVSNMFLMSLAIADLTVGTIVMPISSAYAITGDWRFGYVVCQFWLSVDYTASTASIFNLFILSLDRYWSITSPLRYLRRRTKKRALVMIALAWTGASMWVVPILGWHHVFFAGRRQQPDEKCETEFANNMTFKVVTSILNFYIPTACMVVLYVRIYLVIKRRSREVEIFGGGGGGGRGGGGGEHGRQREAASAAAERGRHDSEAAMTRSNGQIKGGSACGGGGGGRTRRKRMGAHPEEEEESLTEEDTQALAAVAEAEYIRRHSQPKESALRNCCKANPPNARKLPSKKSGSMKLQRDRRLEFHRLALMAFPSEFKGCSGDQCCDSGGGSKTTAAAAAERSLLSGERPNASTAAALGLIPSRKGILRNLRLAAATEKGHKKDASQVDHRAAAAAKMAASAAAGSEEEARLTSEFYEGINVKVELMLSSDDDDNGGEEKAELGNKEQAESETSAASPDVAAVERANSKAETATNSICSASGGVRAASAANGKQQQQQWTVKDKKLSLVIVKPAASESGGGGGDGDERCNHRSGIIAEFPPLPSPSPPPQSSRECSDHSGHLHCYRSNLITGGGGEQGEKRSTAETVTVGVSANGESGVGGKKKKRKRRRRKRNRRDDGDADGDLGDSERRLTSSRSMSVFSSFISRTQSRRWGRRGSAGSADQQKSYMASNGGVTTLRMNFSAAAAAAVSAEGSQNRAMSRTPDVVLAKEKKAATQLGVIVGAFILCWMPYFTLFMVTAYYGDMVNDALFTTAIWFGYFNSALNPILYPFCNANFKRAFKRMLGFSSGTPKAVGSLNSDRQRVVATATGNNHSMFSAAVAATSANRLRPPGQSRQQQQQGVSPRHSSGASFDLQSCVSGNGGGGGVRTQLRSLRS